MGDDVDINQLTPSDLDKLKRPQLQRLCKKYGLRAAGKNVDLIAELSKLCCAAVSSSSPRKSTSEAGHSCPVSKKTVVDSGKRKRKASPLTPPASPESEQSSPAELMASPPIARKQAKARSRKRKGSGAKRRKQSPAKQGVGSDDHISPLKSHLPSPASPRHQLSPKVSRAGSARHGSRAGVVHETTVQETARESTGSTSHARSLKRMNEDALPMPAAKRRRQAKSIVSPIRSPQPLPSKQSQVLPVNNPAQETVLPSLLVQTPQKQQTGKSPRRRGPKQKRLSEAARPSAKSPRKSTSRQPSGKGSRPVKSAPPSAKTTVRAVPSVRKRSSPAGNARKVSHTGIKSLGRQSAPGGGKLASPATQSRKSTGRQSPKKTRSSPKVRSPVPLVCDAAEIASRGSPGLSRRSPAKRLSSSPTKSGGRLTFTKPGHTPSPGPSKEDLKASMLAELDVRVAAKLPTLPAAGSSKIPRFLAGVKAAPTGKGTISGKDWRRIHETGFSKMKSISDHHSLKQQQRSRALAGTQTVDRRKSATTTNASHKPAGSGRDTTDSRPMPKPAVQGTMASGRQSGIDGWKKTPGRPSMAAASAKPQTVFKPPADSANVTFSFGSKTPTTTPFKFGATPRKTVTPKPKFDLKASLQQPLKYKPYTGPIKPSSPSKTKRSSPQKPAKPSGIPQYRATYKCAQTKTTAEVRTANRLAVHQRQKDRRDQAILKHRRLV